MFLTPAPQHLALILENLGYRTPKVNEAVAFICMLNTVLAENKIGTDCNVNNLSHKVIPLGFAPSAKINV